MVPGTNMTFAGIPRGKERADLHHLSQFASRTSRRRCRRAAEAPGAEPKPQ